MIQFYEKQLDEFFVIENLDRKEMVIYNNKGELLVSKCVEINQIKLVSNPKECYYDAQINFIYKNITIKGFLTNNGILSRITSRRNCDTIRNIIPPNTNSYIQLINQKAILKQIAFKEDIKLIPYETIKNIKFIHSKEIIDNFDLLSEVEMLKEENFVTDSLSEPNVLKNENKQAIWTNATRIFESSLKSFKHNFVYIIVAIITILTCILILKFSLLKRTIKMFPNYKNKNKNKRKNKNKKKNKSEKTEVKESESLNEIKIN